MGTLETLDLLKDKVLDAANVEMLKSAYVMQEKNIEQLKTNNDALSQNSALLAEKCEKISAENSQLKHENGALQKKIKSQATEFPHLSEDSFKVLFVYFYENLTKMSLNDFEKLTGMHKIRLKAALGDLRRQELLEAYTSSGVWALTDLGAKFIASSYFEKWTEFMEKDKKE